jgi:hypothetical protein
MATKPQPRRIDAVIDSLEKAQAEAHEILDRYVDEVGKQIPGLPRDVIKRCEIFGRVGFSVDMAEALKLIRKCSFIEDDPHR